MDLTHYDYPIVASSMHDTGTDSYTNRIVLLFARVLNYVFDSSENADAHEWDNLSDQIVAWYRGMPQDFFPLWVDPPNSETERAFPRIFMAQEVHSGLRLEITCVRTLKSCTCSCCISALLPVLACTSDIQSASVRAKL